MRRPSLPPAMEAQHSQSASREGSGRQDPPPSPSEASGHASQTPPPARPPHGRPPHHRQPKRGGFEGQLLRVPQPPSSSSSSSSSSAALGLGAGWQLMEAPGPSGGSFPPPSSSPSSSSTTRGPHPIQELQEGAAPPTRRERKPQKPGKYVCTYCGRPCAKPSVLQKHIRSHTGERPYPCSPCGFSFKTKSNLYKHRKSHAHRIKAGLASGLGGGEGGGTGAGTGLGEEPEEPTEGESTDSEDETGQHQHQHASSHPTSSSSSTAQEKQKSAELPLGLAEELPRPTEDSHAVKQRLAMRLSERKRFPAISPDETPSPSSSLGPGSKGSTESGYFSRSGSAELSQVSPPNANAKSYAEIILGKYGRLGGQPRHPHQQHLHVSSSPSSSSSGLGSEEKSIPFSVPKTQVIEHITKLITINEAVVDTSEIDSVKPRRSSLSRRSSIESPKFSTLKEPYVFDPKGEPSGSGAPLSLGSFSTGESFRSRFTKGDPSAPLLRSQSMPSSAGQVDTAGTSTPNRNFRLTQSFDEQQAAAAEMRVGHHQRMLKRQPAIEVPLGAEFIPEEAGPSSSSCSSSSPFAPAVATPSSDLVRGKAVTQQQHRRGPRLYECEACGARCKKRESYETHRRCFCTANPPQEQQPPPTTATATVTAGAAERPGEAGGTHREDRPQMMHYKFRAVAVAVRKRRKEESLEEDPPSPGPLAVTFPPTPTVPMPEAQPQPDSQRDRKSTWKEISVIQHTSSFEKQESVAMESQEREERPSAALQSSHQDEPQPEKPPQTPTKQHPFSRLVRQHNIQVPEILVTEEPDADMVLASPLATASSSSTKEPEKVEEFQWPQRSQTLAQLPAEKLPPKKKRLRLAEAAQSSGESSFESTSLPRSPSQESSISHASSRSASFEEPGKADTEMQLAAGATGAAHMLTVPSGPHQHHPHREMRRSASEQAPASAQHPAQIAEARSKSFDYGCLSPQRSAAAWKERRKCLLVKHATLGEPEQDEPAPFNPGPTPISSDPSSSSSRLSPEPSGKSLQLFQSPGTPGPSGSPLLSGYPPPSVTREGYPQIGQLFPAAPVAVTVADVLAASQIIPRAFLHTATAPPPIHPAQLRLAERLGLPLQPFPPLLPLGYPTGAAQALYLPVPSGLALQVPQDPPPQDSKSLPSASHSPPIPLHPHPHPIIAPCLEQLAPVVSLVVPVRLQTHVPTYASAMYTTLSQILVTSSHHVPEPVCCSASWVIMGKRVGGVEGGEKAQPQSPYLTVPTPDFKTRMPAGCLALGAELGAGLGEGGAGYGSPGVGGSKRMLSPAGSLELSTEAQRQQKRVKEEEEDKEEEEEEEDNGSDRGGEVSSVGGRTKGKGEGTVVEETITMVQEAETKVQELKEEVPKEEDRKEAGPEKPELLKHEEEEEGEEGRRTRAQSPQGRKSPSPAYPTLHTTTSVSWCYLNYTKPNPSPQQDPHASVYSSWCVSVHNPNLPGLSTRAALSLLRSKQKHSRETYTMANAPHPTSGKLAPGTTRKPRMSEVRSTSPSTPIKVKETPPSEKEKEEEKKGKKDEAAPSTSKRSEQPSRIRIFEGGYKSNEEYVYVRGRGRGKYVCEECGIRCKKPSMLKKHIRTHTDVRPYVCKHCNFAFKTKGNLTKHMKSKAHGKKCQEISEQGGPSLDELEAEDGGGGEERVGGPEDQEEHQFSDVDDSEDDDDNEEEEEEESSSHDEPPSSCSPDTRLSSGGRSDSGLPSQRNTPEPHLPAAQERDPGPSQQDYPSPRKLWPSGRASSPGSKRALFSPRGPWETSPRAFSPSGEGSPLRHLSPGRGISPGREVSPLRCLSPRLEVSPNRHLSPSPERGPSPIRPLSPGRYPSPRALPSPIHPGAHSRVRGSPIRTPGDTPSTDPPEGRQERGMFPEACLFPPALRLSPLPAGESGGGHTSPRRLDHVFSHLPLHSRQGPRAACLMIPIGGIQMVQPWPCPPHPKPSATRPHDRREAFPPATSGRGILQDYRVQEEEAAAGTSSQSGLGAGRRRRATPPDKQDSQTGGEDPTDTGIKQYGSSRTRAHSQGSTLVAATKVGATTSQTSESSSADPSPSQPAPPTHRTRQLSDREGAQGGRGRRRGLEQTGGGAGGRVTASKNKDSKTGST